MADPQVATGGSSSGERGGVREVWWRQLLALLGLTGFAISQPMLSLLGENPVVFSFYGVDGPALVAYAVTLVLVPPLTLWLLGLLVTAVSPRVGWVVHLLTVGSLVALCAVQVVKAVGLERPAVVTLVAIASGVLLARSYDRHPAVALWVRMTAFLPALALLAFLLASPASDLVGGPQAEASSVGANDLPPVVMIVLDELPTKSILDGSAQVDAVRFPNLAAFADDATWYRHYTSVAPATQFAVPAVLTGNRPEDTDPLWTNYPDSLFTLLAPTHDLVALETATDLCGLEQCASGPKPASRIGDLATLTTDLWHERVSPSPNQGARMDTFEEEVGATGGAVEPGTSSGAAGSGGGDPIGERAAQQSQRLARVDRFIETLEPGGARPTFSYLHLMLPHQPWRLYEDGQPYETLSYAKAQYPFSDANDQGPWVAAVTEQRHLLQAQYTDAVVGRVLRELEERDMYDDALVVVLADHGISFEEGTPTRSLDDGTPANVDGLAYSPLLVKAPGQSSGAIDDSNLLSIDVLPTVADVLGLDVPFAVEGLPAGSPALADRGDAKFIFDVGGTFGSSLEGEVEYSDERMPSAADRWIPPVGPGDDARQGLYVAFGLDHLIAADLDSMVTARGGQARVAHLERLLDPPADEPPVGLYSGAVVDPPSADGVVVAAVDGEVVAASPLFTSGGEAGHFALLFPPGAVGGGAVRFALVVGDDVTELDLTS